MVRLIICLFVACLVCSCSSLSTDMQENQPQRKNPIKYDRDCRVFMIQLNHLKPGMSLDEMSKLFSDRSWVDQSLFQSIGFQSGKWFIYCEPNTSIFRIYPFIKEYKEEEIATYWVFVIKVDQQKMALKRLKDFLRSGGGEEIRILEYSIRGNNRLQSYRRISD